MLQVGGKVKGKHVQASGSLARITIGTKGGRQVFMRGSEAVILLGGNYVVKGAPYLPPLNVVQEDARNMAANAAAMTWTPPPAADGSPTTVVPSVRLGAIFEAAMPTQNGGIDSDWAARFDAAVQAFADEGVYVFLDNHQDGLSASNGGEGLPYWMSTYMQASDPANSYVISPTHPFVIGGLNEAEVA